MTAEVGKILKSVQCDITFTFIELSETPNSFVKIPVVLEIRNGASFTKTYLSWKRDFTKTRKNTKKLHASRNYKLVIVVFMPTSPFSNKEKKIWGTLFKRYLHENKALNTLTFYMKINHFNIVFRTTWGKWQRFKSLMSDDASVFSWDPFFLRFRFRGRVRFLDDASY